MPPTATEGVLFSELNTVSPLSDLDLLLIRDVSDTALPGKVRKLTVNALRNAIGGLPSIEDLPSGDIAAPDFRVEGNEGGWSVFIDSVVTDARYYMIYYFEPMKAQYKTIGYIAESRDVASMGPLEINVRAPFMDPPKRQFRIFKVQTITAAYKGNMSTAKSDWSILKLPANWTPNSPTLETSGYPVISYRPMPDGGFGYSVTIKFNAPAGQKDYIKYYEVQRQTDGGVDPWPSDAEWLRLTEHQIANYPAPGYIIYENTDRMFKPGWKYKYRVRAVALNGNRSAWSSIQQMTLTGDTVAPDAPVFTVTEEDLLLRLDFNKPTQGGLPCNDREYWKVEVNKDSAGWNDIGPEDGLLKENVYYHNIGDGSLASSYTFRAKAIDYSGNESGWSGVSDGKSAKKITGDAVDGRTIDAGHVILKALTNAEIADLTLITSKFADLNITETKIGNTAISTPKLQVLIVEGQHIKSLQISTAHLIALNVTGDKVAATTLSLSKLLFTPLLSSGGTGQIVATINATGEGITITAAKTAITSTVGSNTSAINVNAGNINLKVSKNDVINQINISSEGIRIAGDNLSIDANTVFAADVEIQGILKINSGLTTAATGPGTYMQLVRETNDYLRAYYSSSLAMELWRGSLKFNNTIGVDVALMGPIGIGEYGGQFVAKTAENTNTCKMTGGGFYFGGNKVVGARGAAIANATDAPSTMARLNDVLAFLRGWGAIAT